MKRNFSGAGLRLLTALLLVGRSPELFAAEPTPLDTFDARARLVMDAALSDVAKLNGGSPMHFWIAQRLFEQGEKERALAIVKSGVKLAREFIEKRERGKHNNIGYNGFMYWAMLNCYVHWHRQFDQELLDDYRYLFTDRDGVVIERTFNGDTRINGERVAYETWPLLDNPWMRQEFGGNLTLTDGKTTRYYDVTNWTITETTKP